MSQSSTFDEKISQTTKTIIDFETKFIIFEEKVHKLKELNDFEKKLIIFKKSSSILKNVYGKVKKVHRFRKKSSSHLKSSSSNLKKVQQS